MEGFYAKTKVRNAHRSYRGSIDAILAVMAFTRGRDLGYAD
jgi:hypothetical protein